MAAAITIAASIIAAAWCLTQGSTISASASVGNSRPSVWGVSLNLIGILILVYGFAISLMLMIEQTLSFMTFIVGILLLLGIGLIVTVVRSRGDEKSISTSLESLSTWGIVTAIAFVLSLVLIIVSGGGESALIPDFAWPLLMGALTMIGAGWAAAVCIIAAVRAGSDMLQNKPELSIWSLLFVALGEGLAIYGLIVAILIIST